MNIGFAVWILLAPIIQASQSDQIQAGAWPAGVLFQAAARVAECPVYPESPTIGNTVVILERDLLVARGNLPAILSLLHDSGIALIELSPGVARDGWMATRHTAGIRRPIRVRVRVLSLEHADPAEIALALNARVEEREALLPPGDTMTHFVADPRSGSLIARYTSEERLLEYLEFLTERDRPAAPGTDHPILRTYRPSWVTAPVLHVLFDIEWKKIKGQTIRVVVPETQNVLLVRCPVQTWPLVEELLQSLDRPE